MSAPQVPAASDSCNPKQSATHNKISAPGRRGHNQRLTRAVDGSQFAPFLRLQNCFSTPGAGKANGCQRGSQPRPRNPDLKVILINPKRVLSTIFQKRKGVRGFGQNVLISISFVNKELDRRRINSNQGERSLSTISQKRKGVRVFGQNV
jgi:hypothetical protein